MDKEEKQKHWKEVREGAWDMWKWLFTFQLVFGGHAIYELAATYPDIGLIEYAFVLSMGAAGMATLSILALVGIIAIAAVVFAGIMTVKEKFSA